MEGKSTNKRGSVMNNPHPQSARPFSELLATARERVGLSYGQLEQTTGIAKTTLHKLEQGQVQHPNPTMLPSLAAALDVPLADLYSAAGYELPSELPTFTPYLRSKYAGLSADAQAELSEAFTRITGKYGYSPDGSGPAPGQDE